MKSCIRVIGVRYRKYMYNKFAEGQFLEGIDFPMPAGTCYLVSVDEDVSIRIGLFESLLSDDQTKGTIVLSHGYAEYMEKYAETVSDFLNLGYRVAMVEWRSHGCSGGRSDIRREVLHFKDFDKNISDLNIVMRDFVMQRFPPPYFGVSHSMGGQINIRTAVLHQGLFNSLALSAPMIGLREHPLQISLLKAVTSINELFGLGHRPLESAATDRATGRSSYNRVTMDDSRFERNERIVDRHPHVNIAFKSHSWSVGAVNAMQKTLKKSFLSRLDIPVFIGIAEDERLVANTATYKAIALSDYIEGKLYPNTRHELFMETDASRQAFLEDIDNHFMNASRV
ncbi:MAG: hypothetical protein CBE09_04710 [Rhizobiales bacterium TMED249]|uniref:Alpha/beta hydrolase n=1 Tax=PS1 clade bacterium TaxID=2175152 RepID=A0A368DWA0_9PROT|nr:MAG: hypothetical protein CBE09_04710 [Rhizobiales bacterium TMED249]RCL76089.1 MAG: alpha/beta hydrolase [PS1 clade bacterium]HCV48411.1 hypothetical protein [Rhodobiaceae bacterium]